MLYVLRFDLNRATWDMSGSFAMIADSLRLDSPFRDPMRIALRIKYCNASLQSLCRKQGQPREWKRKKRGPI